MNRTVKSVPGILVLAVWSVYVLLIVLRLPDWSGWAITSSICGVLTCLAVITNFRYWRATAILASLVYVGFYAAHIIRLAALAGELEKPSLLATLSRHYSTSWMLTNGMFLERGVFWGSVHAFLEYAMPVLVVALIIDAAIPRRIKAF